MDCYNMFYVGEVESYDRLIRMSMKHVYNTEADLEAARIRTEEIKRLNDQTESTIQNIPATTKQTITESSSKGWWIFKSNRKTTRTIDVITNYPFKLMQC